MSTRDTAPSLDDLTPWDYLPWATDVPGRGWRDSERFKRHATLGHAKSSLKNSRRAGKIYQWTGEQWREWTE